MDLEGSSDEAGLRWFIQTGFKGIVWLEFIAFGNQLESPVRGKMLPGMKSEEKAGLRRLIYIYLLLLNL